jgi:ribosomal protein S18 acetylase RimI-like enzyme
MTVSYRVEAPNDEPAGDRAFLRRLIMDTIALELGAQNWPEPMRTHLLGIQYENRRHGPRISFPQGESRIILCDGTPAGWLFFATLPDHLYIAEIMVAPEHRGKGVGTAAIREILALAAAAGKPVQLTVHLLNATAIRLYERLGFRCIGKSDLQQTMEARPRRA